MLLLALRSGGVGDHREPHPDRAGGEGQGEHGAGARARREGARQGLHAFPGPSRLARFEGFPGLFGRKAEYLRSLGRVAAEGKLDASYLRSLPVEEALEELKKLPGIGPFSAELILLRGAGERTTSGERAEAG